MTDKMREALEKAIRPYLHDQIEPHAVDAAISGVLAIVHPPEIRDCRTALGTPIGHLFVDDNRDKVSRCDRCGLPEKDYTPPAALSTKQEAGEEEDDGPTQSIKDGAQQLRDLYPNPTSPEAGEVSRSQTAQALEEAAKVADGYADSAHRLLTGEAADRAYQASVAIASRIRALSLPAPDADRPKPSIMPDKFVWASLALMAHHGGRNLWIGWT